MQSGSLSKIKSVYVTGLALLLTASGLVSVQASAAQSQSWSPGSEIAWNNLVLETQWYGGLTDIDLMIGGTRTETDVLDTFWALYVTQGPVIAGNTQALCGAGTGSHSSLANTEYLLIECDSGAQFSADGIVIKRQYYFWDNGDKFRTLTTIENQSNTEAEVSLEFRNNHGSTDNHWDFQNSNQVSLQGPLVANIEYKDDMNQANARWSVNQDRRDAVFAMAWGSDQADQVALVDKFRDEDAEFAFNGLKIPAQGSITLAKFFYWPASWLIANNYSQAGNFFTLSPAGPGVPKLDETVATIAAMQSSPTDDMWRFIDDPRVVANWFQAPPPPPAPYTGPLLQEFSSRTLDPCTPKSITITGTRLSGVTASIQGKSVTVLENTDTKLVLAVPAGLTPGSGVDLDINSSSGRLTFQDAFDIPANTCSLELSKGRWTQLQPDGKTVKMYAKDPVGDGKIQFFVDGKEIAWINAIDLADPKLSFASSNPYLVRSVTLNPGKNRFEIKLDGVRVWRATYVPKG